MGEIDNTLLMQRLTVALNRIEVAERVSKNGGGGNGIEARVARLEASVQHIESDITEIKSDLRSLLKSGLATFAGGFLLTWAGLFTIAYMMAKGFHWL